MSEKTVLDQRAYIIFYVRKPSAKPARTPEPTAPSKPVGVESKSVPGNPTPSEKKSASVSGETAKAPAVRGEPLSRSVPAETTTVDGKVKASGVNMAKSAEEASAKTDAGGKDLRAEGGKGAGAGKGADEPPAEDVGVPVGRDERQKADADMTGSGKGASTSVALDEDYWDRYYSQHW